MRKRGPDHFWETRPNANQLFFSSAQQTYNLFSMGLHRKRLDNLQTCFQADLYSDNWHKTTITCWSKSQMPFTDFFPSCILDKICSTGQLLCSPSRRKSFKHCRCSFCCFFCFVFALKVSDQLLLVWSFM